MKRCFDVIFSGLGIFLLLPFFFVVAIIIKLDSKGPVFFKQERIGKNFKPFYILKFRTMVENADKKGPHVTSSKDRRITRVGKILRKAKVDELPQLINILNADMSLVGPRPEVRKYVNRYVEDYKEILAVRPGITDISSIRYADEEALLQGHKATEDYYVEILLPKKILLAKEYIQKASLVYDIKLIFRTFKRVFCVNQKQIIR